MSDPEPTLSAVNDLAQRLMEWEPQLSAEQRVLLRNVFQTGANVLLRSAPASDRPSLIATYQGGAEGDDPGPFEWGVSDFKSATDVNDSPGRGDDDPPGVNTDPPPEQTGSDHR
jgi:hypothetical protein